MSASNSLPLTHFSTKGDAEVIPTQEIPDSNAAFLMAVMGVESNHSSLERSLPDLPSGGNQPASGVQYNDDELGDPSQGHLDPQGPDVNMSGPHATKDIQEVCAGPMQGASPSYSLDSAEDYHQFIEFSGHSQAFGDDSVSPQGDFGSSHTTVAGIVVSPIVRRA